MRAEVAVELVFQLFEEEQEVGVGEAAADEEDGAGGEEGGEEDAEGIVAEDGLAIVGLAEDDGVGSGPRRRGP